MQMVLCHAYHVAKKPSYSQNWKEWEPLGESCHLAEMANGSSRQGKSWARSEISRLETCMEEQELLEESCHLAEMANGSSRQRKSWARSEMSGLKTWVEVREQEHQSCQCPC